MNAASNYLLKLFVSGSLCIANDSFTLTECEGHENVPGGCAEVAFPTEGCGRQGQDVSVGPEPVRPIGTVEVQHGSLTGQAMDEKEVQPVLAYAYFKGESLLGHTGKGFKLARKVLHFQGTWLGDGVAPKFLESFPGVVALILMENSRHEGHLPEDAEGLPGTVANDFLDDIPLHMGVHG